MCEFEIGDAVWISHNSDAAQLKPREFQNWKSG